MSVLHTIYITEANCPFENIELEDIETRNNYASKTPTTTFPFLETTEGNISETNAILFYLAQKYKKDLLGKNIFENAKINQWIEFATCEINNCQKSLIYPIFGWKEFSKEKAEKESTKLKGYLNILEKELTNKDYLIGNRSTLADIILFRYIRFFMMLYFPEGMRKNLLPNVTKWFENIMKTSEAIKAYGKTILCKTPLRPFMQKINKNKPKIQNENKKEEKEEKEEKDKNNNDEDKNRLDLFASSAFSLEEFKKCFLNNKNKEEVLKKFWEKYNSEEYSIWWLDLQNLPDKGKILASCSETKNAFLQKLQKLDSFRKNCFGVHGVYGTEGKYKIRGVWMWKGKDIPKEIQENEYYDYMTIRELNHNEKEDVELINDYWTKLTKTDKVQGRYAVDCNYFS